MKKLTLITVFTFNFLLITINLFSQPCLPEGIIFSTQEEIDNFQTNYPGCTEIEGDVEIHGVDIANLDGLNGLTSLGGKLIIGTRDLFNWMLPGNPSLSSIAGLSNVTFIGGGLYIGRNDTLVNLAGLDNVSVIAGDLWIVANTNLNSLSGLENLSVVEGDLFIGAYWGLFWIDPDNPSLTSLMGLSNVSSIGGTIRIAHNDALTSLAGLDNLTSIGGGFIISDNESLGNITGLDSLTSIGGRLYFGYNDSLTNVEGLNNLASVGGDLSFSENYVLTSLSGLSNLSAIGGKLSFRENTALTDLTDLDNIEAGSITELFIVDNTSLSSCEAKSICDYLATPNGIIEIHDNAPGCNSKEEVQEACDSIASVWEICSENTFTISPNPMNPTTLIQYTLNQNSEVTLQILDLSGRLVAFLVNEVQQQGEQQVIFNTSDLPAGIYFCILKTNPARVGQTKKIIKLN